MTEFDDLTAQMRRTEPYLEDHGFTAAVLAQLPVRQTLPAWKKNLILLLATAAGSALAAWQFPAAQLIPAIFAAWNVPFLAGAALMVYALTGGLMWFNRRELI